MTSRIIILCIGLNLSIQLFAQVERQAVQNIRKGNWEKANTQLTKAARNDSVNIAVSYAWAIYFFSTANPHYDLDSANYHLRKAISQFQGSTLKQQDRLKRMSIDSAKLNDLRQKIDSIAFHRAITSDTTVSYQHFVDHFPGSIEFQTVIKLRNKAAYRDALRTNTYRAFREFLTQYPAAEETTEAKAREDRLLYDSMTRSKRLVSYQQYLQHHPGTRYQDAAEQNIFEIRTASGSPDSFMEFVTSSNHSLGKRAQDILFHLIPEENQGEKLSSEFWNDSLKNVISITRNYVAPFLHNGRFGFMDPDGKTLLEPLTEVIDDDYLCGNISDDVIRMPDKLVAINGSVVYEGAITLLEDVGYGYLLVQDGECKKVIHKSGFIVGDDCIDNVKVVNGRFLTLQRNDKWSIFSLTGRMLLYYELDSIATSGDVVIIQAQDKYKLMAMTDLTALADHSHNVDESEADDIKTWSGGRIWVRTNHSETVIDNALDTLFSAIDHTLSQTTFGALSRGTLGTQVITNKGDTSQTFQQVRIQGGRTLIKKENRWHLFDPVTLAITSRPYDTISANGPFAVGSNKDSVFIHFSGSAILKIKQPIQTQFVAGQDSVSYLVVADKRNKVLYGSDGKKLFSTPFDRIQYIGEGYFMVYDHDKIGMMDMNGKLIIPVEMDAIGSPRDGVVSLLKDTKFGAFNIKTRKLIPPQFAKNVVAYNQHLICVFKKGYYALSGWDNKPITKPEFDEIRYWNDSAAFVRKNTTWVIYEIKTGTPLLNDVKNYELIRDENGEKLAIVQAGREYGVFHSTQGTIIPLSFSDIINVGSAERPLYFTEKHVEEAAVFVVIYYDSAGKMLRKEVYEQDEYERIYCSNN